MRCHALIILTSSLITAAYPTEFMSYVLRFVRIGQSLCVEGNVTAAGVYVDGRFTTNVRVASDHIWIQTQKPKGDLMLIRHERIMSPSMVSYVATLSIGGAFRPDPELAVADCCAGDARFYWTFIFSATHFHSELLSQGSHNRCGPGPGPSCPMFFSEWEPWRHCSNPTSSFVVM
ncbi:uncharacterized protein L969DRAFT_17197 [Mixia osmundae IAM 14324]|uniref:Uncharacterized protein n=1 Tax=Mixia osmundae (strain CBS 9802 / IAM 14324 / JCM 22182 / KY 12970) TaxID=764103 RepID=G7DZR0_MIXOS|nr:uncharacterized protein L969DRAFT_17197 [Mixia osmundae IAM 14324]KEI39271.1 hypothetical protein L969DRAFT_17197 [Mixia osmundae IAM 14324]GAA96070.1 hypothetical protein E5Q_02731 [Mixia osmundae IAM 14324]